MKLLCSLMGIRNKSMLGDKLRPSINSLISDKRSLEYSSSWSPVIQKRAATWFS